jgi:nucleotide-binding universal stress UspA family protein
LFKKILVATDGSEHAKHAITYAVESALKWNAELIVISVIPRLSPMVYNDEYNIQYLSQLEESMRESHQKLLSETTTKLKVEHPNLKIKDILKEGRPALKIIEVAREEDVDLIVMGSRGLGGVTGTILGSTSQSVVHSCTKPILIVK